MNLKSILLTTILLFNMACNAGGDPVNYIASDVEFSDITTDGISIIAIGSEENRLATLALAKQLNVIENQNIFPEARFYYAFEENLSNAVTNYELNSHTVAVFENGSIVDVIQVKGNETSDWLIEQLKSTLKKSLIKQLNQQSITQITSPDLFNAIVAYGKSAVAIGSQQVIFPVGILINQLTSIMSQFPNVKFYWAFMEDITGVNYEIGNIPLVGAFNNGRMVGNIQAPLSTPSLLQQLKSSLG